MSSIFGFSISCWSAWAPGLATLGEWTAWSKNPQRIASPDTPKTSLAHAGHRRRTSQLSRMAIETAVRCIPNGQQVRSVFASRHGECRVAQTLLETLAKRELLSPLGFSLSVHNTAAGLCSIMTGNHAASSSVAAGKQSFCCGLLEALGVLARHPSEPVLLVAADEYPPPILLDVIDEPPAAFAFSALLQHASHGANVEVELGASPPEHPAPAVFPEVLQFISWLVAASPAPLSFHDLRQCWYFRSKNNTFSSSFLPINA